LSKLKIKSFPLRDLSDVREEGEGGAGVDTGPEERTGGGRTGAGKFALGL
jgi:hypothetical protein